MLGPNLSVFLKSGSFCRIATILSISERERGDHNSLVSAVESKRRVFLHTARSEDIVCPCAVGSFSGEAKRENRAVGFMISLHTQKSMELGIT